MKYIALMVALMAAFFMSGCAFVADDLVEAKEFLKGQIGNRAQEFQDWRKQSQDLTETALDGLSERMEELFRAGDIEGAIEAYNKAKRIHEGARPVLMIEHLRDVRKSFDTPPLEP